MAIVNGLCALYASDHTRCLFLLMFLGPFLINQSINLSMPPLPSFIILMTLLFTNAMDKVYWRWPRWPSGCRQITCRRSFSSAVYLVFQTSQHTLPRVKHFVKLRVSDVRTIQQQCGANCILSVNFCASNVHTILQQGGANRILSIYFCERDVHMHSATVWGKSFLFSKFSWAWCTYHSWLYWGSLRLTPKSKGGSLLLQIF